MTDRFTFKKYTRALNLYLGLHVIADHVMNLSDDPGLNNDERATLRKFSMDLKEIEDRVYDGVQCLKVEIESKLDERPEVRE